MTITKLWEAPTWPQPSDFDGLFILGGPMNVYERREYPWLAAEQQFIASSISMRKPVLGICLGAQLLAVVLGGTVTQMVDQEIGWFPVDLTPAGREVALFRDFPNQFLALHWHADSFSIPPGAVHVARSEGCEEQAFVYENHVVGLQFHLESDKQAVAAMIRCCGDGLCSGPYIQDLSDMTKQSNSLPTAPSLLFSLLDRLSSRSKFETQGPRHSREV